MLSDQAVRFGHLQYNCTSQSEYISPSSFFDSVSLYVVVIVVNGQRKSLGQCITPPRHVFPVSRYRSGSGIRYSGSVIRIATKFCSVAHCQPFLKISCKSDQNFLRKGANRQTATQTDIQTNNDDYITSLAEVKKMLLNRFWVHCK